MNNRLENTVRLIEKWAVSFIVLTAFYFFSINVIRSTYIMVHPPEDERHMCGMPILGCIIAQITLTVLALAITFIRMAIGKGFKTKHYLITTALLLTPLLIVFYLIFS